MKKFKLQLNATYKVSEEEVLNFLRRSDDSIQAEDLTDSDYFDYANFLATWGDDSIAPGIDIDDWEIVDSWEE